MELLLDRPLNGSDLLPPAGAVRMYAITFDLDQGELERRYGSPPYKDAYRDVRKRLEEDGLTWMQGSLYYGDPRRIDAVSA